MALRIHAICLALNEESFITETIKVLYPFCSGISILSQYDRDWYGKPVVPDKTSQIVLDFPDPEGKLHLIVRRWRDQAAALNSEMLALASNPAKGVLSHGTPLEEIKAFHQKPDYFLFVDADEVYDIDTFPQILEYLEAKKPRGMRVLGYNYVRTWNQRVPSEVIEFKQFGFVQPGILFEHIRVVSWNEHRLSKLCTKLHLPDISAKLYGFIDCPAEIGVFHHGCWLGSDKRLEQKFSKSAHKTGFEHLKELHSIDNLQTIHVPTNELPRNIKSGNWPLSFFTNDQHG